MSKTLKLCTLAFASLPCQVPAATFVDLFVPGVRDHAFSKDGHLLMTSGNKLVDYDTNTCSSTVMFDAGVPLLGVDFSTDGNMVAVASYRIEQGYGQFHYTNRSFMREFVTQHFPAGVYEQSTFMPAWTQDNKLLISSSYPSGGAGSLREFDPESQSLVSIASVTQNTFLASAAASPIVAIGEGSNILGPLHALDTSTGSIVASINTQRYIFDVAVNFKGNRFVVPSYSGARVYDLIGASFVLAGVIGQHGETGAVGAVFSPDGTKLITANWHWRDPAHRGLRIYDASTLAPIASVDNYDYSWGGTAPFAEGRLSISPDGQWVVANIANYGVRLYNVSQELNGVYTEDCTGGKSLSIREYGYR